MKRVEFKVDSYFDTILTSSFRSKYDIIMFILRLTKLFIIGYQGEENLGCVIVYIDKMSRVIVSYNSKLFSIVYPFNLTVNDNEIISVFDPITGGEIDSKMISALLSYLESDFIDRDVEDTFYDLLDYVDAYEYDSREFWTIIRNLYMFESGYIRYDCDTNNPNEYYHPINHLDINFSSKGTYKVGLYNNITSDDLMTVMLKDSECYYLSKYENKAKKSK